MTGLNIENSRWKRCWTAAPDIFLLLRESDNLDIARQKLVNYLNAIELALSKDLYQISSSTAILLRNAVHFFKNMAAPRSERIAGASPLEMLWAAARNGDSDVEEGFIDEFEHLFSAVKCVSGVYPSRLMTGVEEPDFKLFKGREAAEKRSEFLDKLAGNIHEFMARYPDGLRPGIMARREENRKRILNAFGAGEAEWNDYRWQFKHVIRNEKDIDRIKQAIILPPEQENSIRLAIRKNVPFAVTPHYLHLMDYEPSGFDRAVRRQVFPPESYTEAMAAHSGDRCVVFDFMREHDTSPVDSITRRYPMVAIIKPVDTCPQICVYCQRNWQIESPGAEAAVLDNDVMEGAFQWLENHPNIMDVLITGGDPLILNNKQLEFLLSRLGRIRSIIHIRIATRTLVTAPQRFNDELLELLSSRHNPPERSICLVTHFQHPYEICGESAESIRKIRSRGMMVYNQQVFTFDNSRRFETVALRIALKRIGVDPYYLFNMKGKKEMAGYAAPVARLLQELKEEARLLPGVFRTDEPVFNVPFLGKNHLRAWQHHELLSIRPSGARVYAFHPWEKNIREEDSYIYTDIPIRQYLEKLAEVGEAPDDYGSIWFYY